VRHVATCFATGFVASRSSPKVSLPPPSRDVLRLPAAATILHVPDNHSDSDLCVICVNTTLQHHQHDSSPSPRSSCPRQRRNPLEAAAQVIACRPPSPRPPMARKRSLSAHISLLAGRQVWPKLWSGTRAPSQPRPLSQSLTYSHPLDTIKVRMQLSRSRKLKGVRRASPHGSVRWADLSSNPWASSRPGDRSRREKLH